MRRHRALVSGAATAMLVAAVSLGIATALLASANGREQEARARADKNLARARKAVEEYCTSVAEDRRLKQQDLHLLRKKLLETALPFYDEIVREEGNDPALRVDQGRAYSRLAFLRRELGETEQARNDFIKALKLQERLAADFPSTLIYRAELGETRKALGNVLFDLGRLEEVRTAYAKAIELEEQIAAEHPSAPMYRFRLAGTYTNLGYLLNDLGRHEESRAVLIKAIELQERLAAENPSASDYRFELSQSLGNLANTLSDMHRWEEALTMYTKGIDLQERLVVEQPPNPVYRADLATSRNNLGNLLSSLGRDEECGPSSQRPSCYRSNSRSSIPPSLTTATSLLGAAIIWAKHCVKLAAGKTPAPSTARHWPLPRDWSLSSLRWKRTRRRWRWCTGTWDTRSGTPDNSRSRWPGSMRECPECTSYWQKSRGWRSPGLASASSAREKHWLWGDSANGARPCRSLPPWPTIRT